MDRLIYADVEEAYAALKARSDAFTDVVETFCAETLRMRDQYADPGLEAFIDADKLEDHRRSVASMVRADVACANLKEMAARVANIVEVEFRFVRNGKVTLVAVTVKLEAMIEPLIASVSKGTERMRVLSGNLVAYQHRKAGMMGDRGES